MWLLTKCLVQSGGRAKSEGSGGKADRVRVMGKGTQRKCKTEKGTGGKEAKDEQ